MCVLLFSITFLETVFMLRRTERDMIRNVFMSVLLFKFLLNLNCFYRFTKKYSNIIFSEIPPSGSRVPCGRTDRRTNIPTDMTKLMVVFSNFTKVPKNRCNTPSSGLLLLDFRRRPVQFYHCYHAFFILIKGRIRKSPRQALSSSLVTLFQV